MMKIGKEPVSAFAVYSQKFKQKKKSNPVIAKGVNGVNKKKPLSNHLKLLQIKEIGEILKKLADQSPLEKLNSVKKNITKSNSKIKHAKTSEGLVTDTNLLNKIKESVVEKDKENDNHIQDIGINVYENNLIQFKNKLPENHKKAKKSIDKTKKTDTRHNMRLSRPNEIYDKNTKEKRVCTVNNSIKSKGMHIKTIHKTSSKKVNAKKNDKQYDMEKRTAIKSKTKKELIARRRKKKIATAKNINKWTNQEDSILAAKCLFEWLVQPIPQKDFIRRYWEKQPLLIQRDENRNYYSELLSTPAIDAMLRENNIHFTKHLDVTSYTDGKRETHNLSGRAQANVVWDFYSNGCSIRLLNPQAFIPKIHTLNATLQEYFGCFVGANVYLTPPNSQGFAPHYDDIEAFVLQIEGKKHWKVYQPRNDEETLPRYSSANFTEDEIGTPFLDVTLEPGDMLYFPRGFIHQASTVENEHSLHITLSAFQKTAWVDLLEKALPVALKRAAVEDVEFRRGLPRNYLGIEYHGNDVTKVSFLETAQRLMGKLSHYLSLSLGAGVDLMGAQFMHDALPPVFTHEEKLNSGLGGGLKLTENGKLVNRVEIQLHTEVKLIRANVCRLVEEEDEVRLYHCLDNPLEYHAEEPQFLVLPPEGVTVITFLATSYPAFVQVTNIPNSDEEALLTLLSDLWDAGLLVTRGLNTAICDN